jgi:regulator of RNase E activity RraA
MRKKACYHSLFCLVLFTSLAAAQQMNTPQGVRLLENKSFDDSERARSEILELYRDMRVTDVCDGMDLVGLQDNGLMYNTIRSLWRDVDNFSHRFVGFAVTVRHVPSDVRQGQGSFQGLEGFLRFKDVQYSRAPDAWTRVARPNDCAVIDANGVFEVGFIGSNNSLGYAENGIAGVVTNGWARDTDEIVKTKAIPVYCKNAYSGRGIRPGRLIAESYNFPVNCGGVLVYPGDVVVGDGDGVIVVPRELALTVGKLARGIMVDDEASRGERYQRLGIPPDETVNPR